MLIENQLVEVKWNGFTKKYYEDLGYLYTKMRDSFFVDIKDLLPNSTAKVDVICDYCKSKCVNSCAQYNKNTLQGTKKYACQACGGKKNIEYNFDREKYFNDFVKLCENLGYEVLSKIDEYKNAHSKLRYICPKHGKQVITYDSIKRGCGCNMCGYESSTNKNKKSKQEVISIVESKNDNFLLNPDDYINVNEKNLKILCGSCSEVFVTSLESIQQSDGACINCGIKKSSNSNKLSSNQVELIINSINDNILLNSNEYINTKTRNLRIKCGECKNNVFITSLCGYIYDKTTRCRMCSYKTSSGEKIIEQFLKEHNILFEAEKRFANCKDKRPLPFDFYLPEYNICIEFDGQQHYEPKFGIEKFESTTRHDDIKNKYCKNNNIKLIRIPYWEGSNIESILSKSLNIYKKIKPKYRIINK